MPQLQEMFLQFSVTKLQEFVNRIEVCLGKLSDDQIWARGHDTENAIGNLLLHLNGNVRQWIITSLTEQTDARERDAEFAARGGITKDELFARLSETVEEANTVIATCPRAKLEAIHLIQKRNVTGVHAIYHVVEHFAMHTGQIILLTKAMTGTDLGFYSKHTV